MATNYYGGKSIQITRFFGGSRGPCIQLTDRGGDYITFPVDEIEDVREGLQKAAEDAEVFRECPACAAKPGSPQLCESCLRLFNRALIERLKGEL